jgi:hypothetical protein
MKGKRRRIVLVFVFVGGEGGGEGSVVVTTRDARFGVVVWGFVRLALIAVWEGDGDGVGSMGRRKLVHWKQGHVMFSGGVRAGILLLYKAAVVSGFRLCNIIF